MHHRNFIIAILSILWNNTHAKICRNDDVLLAKSACRVAVVAAGGGGQQPTPAAARHYKTARQLVDGRGHDLEPIMTAWKGALEETCIIFKSHQASHGLSVRHLNSYVNGIFS